MKDVVDRIREIVRDDLVVGDDGFHLYWPEAQRGGWPSHALRIIADYIDELDEPWRLQMEDYFKEGKEA